MKLPRIDQTPAVRLTASALLCLAAASAALAQPTDNPVKTFYDSNPYSVSAGGNTLAASAPAWTDDIAWNNVTVMSDQGSGAANFAAFEAARDTAHAAGGGVLYYPAGTYQFALPANGQGPDARGLMLKTGVVIRGATPVGDNTGADGSLDLLTKFEFEYQDSRVDVNGDGQPDAGGPEIPYEWNIIGMTPSAGEELSDINTIGVAWVELIGGTIFWGPQYRWASSYEQGLFQSSAGFRNDPDKRVKDNWPASGTKWNARVADGTFWADPFNGSLQVGVVNETIDEDNGSGRADLVGMADKLLVFGVKITDGVKVVDHRFAGDRSLRVPLPATGGLNEQLDIFEEIFAGKISVYGSNVLIANNALPKSSKSFVFEYWPLNETGDASGFFNLRQTALFSYDRQIGIDVNKSFLGIASADFVGNSIDVGGELNPTGTYEFGVTPGSNDYYQNSPGQGYAAENVIVRDNYVFNYDRQGFSIGGSYAVVVNNTNERWFADLTVPASYVANDAGSGGVSSADFLHLDGKGRFASANGNIAFNGHAFDFAGRNLWASNNKAVNVGNWGQIAYGMLSQDNNSVDLYSQAWTYNEMTFDAQLLGAPEAASVVGLSDAEANGSLGSDASQVYGWLLLGNTALNSVANVTSGDDEVTSPFQGSVTGWAGFPTIPGGGAANGVAGGVLLMDAAFVNVNSTTLQTRNAADGNESPDVVSVGSETSNVFELFESWFVENSPSIVPFASNGWGEVGTLVDTSNPATHSIVAPVNVSAVANGDAIEISWEEGSSLEAFGEAGYRIERRVDGGSWEVIAYRPRQAIHEVLRYNFNFTTGNVPGEIFGDPLFAGLADYIDINRTGDFAVVPTEATDTNGLPVRETDRFSDVLVGDLNPPLWCDFTAPSSGTLEYRVVAINSADNSSAASGAVSVGGSALVVPTVTITTSGSTATITFDTVSGQTYQIKRSGTNTDIDNPAVYTDEGAPIAGDDTTKNINVTLTEDREFFIVEVSN